MKRQRSGAAVNLLIHTCRKYVLMKRGARASRSESSVPDHTSYDEKLATVVDMQTVYAEVNLKTQ